MNRYTFKGQVKYSGNHYDYKEWVIGDLIHKDGKTYIYDTEEVVMDLGNGKHGYPGARLEEVEIIPETLCQCTGLQDKDGKDIFENDKIRGLRHHNKKQVIIEGFVEYNEFLARYDVTGNYYNGNQLSAFANVEIIGNKFDKEVE